MIDRSTIEKVIAASNVKDIVAEFVKLRRSGQSYKGLCPFHHEDTPSFYVWPQKGTWHCFGCGEGGDVISFIQKKIGISYPETIKWLGERFGVEVTEQQLSDKERLAQKKLESLYILNDYAAKYYSAALDNEEETLCREYLKGRGISEETAKTFRLGYAHQQYHAFSRTAVSKGFSEANLIDIGLSYKNKRGELADRFYDRLIFPWIDSSGRIVAFGGRKIVAGTKGIDQKYINSKESEIFHKGHELYGIWQAKEAIREKDQVYLVEGYFDVIAMYQAGIHNVVANSGTILSQYQVDLLCRFTKNIVVIYDGDEAGRLAIERSSKLLLQGGMNVSVVILEDGNDPDSFIKEKGQEEFLSYLTQNTQDAISYQIENMLHPEEPPVIYSQKLSAILEEISFVQNPVQQVVYLHRCAERTGIHQTILYKLLENFK